MAGDTLFRFNDITHGGTTAAPPSVYQAKLNSSVDSNLTVDGQRTMLGLYFYPRIVVELNAKEHTYKACNTCIKADYGNGQTCNRPFKDGVPSISEELAAQHAGFIHPSLISTKDVSTNIQDYVLSASKFVGRKPRVSLLPNCFLSQNIGYVYFNDSSPDLLGKWQQVVTTGPLQIHVIVHRYSEDLADDAYNVIKVVLGGQNNLKPYEVGAPARITVFAASATYSDSLSAEDTCSLSFETQDLIARLSRWLKPGQGTIRGHPVPSFAAASDCSSLMEVQHAVHSLADRYHVSAIHILASSAGTRAVTPFMLLLKTMDPENCFPIKSAALFAPAAPLYHFGLLDALVSIVDVPIAIFSSSEDKLCKCAKAAFKNISLVHFDKTNFPYYMS